MSEDSIRPHIHPFNYFLTQRLNEIWLSLEEHDYSTAIMKTHDLTLYLEPKIRSALKDEIAHAERIIANPSIANGLFARQFIKKLMALLHRAGYFTLAKFQPITSETFKELEDEK
ncbi:MAG: hypothetical protein DRP00_04790 [Candidatus Aenigmatarchaeota archaeon]|nr:MAG: hypothetical protein DRP00_04790 [Candidatus Aenigmarchaeota archaeon]